MLLVLPAPAAVPPKVLRRRRPDGASECVGVRANQLPRQAVLRAPAAALALVGRNRRLRLSHAVLPVGGEGSRARIALGDCISRSPRGEPLLRHVDTPRYGQDYAMKTPR